MIKGWMKGIVSKLGKVGKREEKIWRVPFRLLAGEEKDRIGPTEPPKVCYIPIYTTNQSSFHHYLLYPETSVASQGYGD